MESLTEIDFKFYLDSLRGRGKTVPGAAYAALPSTGGARRCSSHGLLPTSWRSPPWRTRGWPRPRAACRRS
eukprot:4455297-Pyramimonas_sp.AAC.1